MKSLRELGMVGYLAGCWVPGQIEDHPVYEHTGDFWGRAALRMAHDAGRRFRRQHLPHMDDLDEVETMVREATDA